MRKMTFGPRRAEVRGGMETTKCRGTLFKSRWACGAQVCETRNAYKVLVGNEHGKRKFEDTQDDGRQVNLKQIGLNWISMGTSVFYVKPATDARDPIQHGISGSAK